MELELISPNRALHRAVDPFFSAMDVFERVLHSGATFEILHPHGMCSLVGGHVL